MPAHLLLDVVQIAAHERAVPLGELVQMPWQHDGQKCDGRRDQRSRGRARGCRGRDPEDGQDRDGDQRERALGEKGDAEPRAGAPEAAASPFPRARHGQQREQRGQEHHRIEEQRAREPHEARREREDRARREPHVRSGEQRPEPREDEAREHAGHRAREPRAPRRHAERLERERGEPDDERGFVEERLPSEEEGAPVPALHHRLGERGIDHRVPDEVTRRQAAGHHPGRERDEGEKRPASQAGAVRTRRCGAGHRRP